MSSRTDPSTAHGLPGDRLALGLALPSARRRDLPRTLLESLPFLALGRRGQGPVPGAAIEHDRMAAMVWAGPNVLGWTDRTVLDRPVEAPHVAPTGGGQAGSERTRSRAGLGASASAGPQATGVSEHRPSLAGTPQLGIMLATAGARARRQAPSPELRRQGPALLGLIGQGNGRSPKVIAERGNAMLEGRDRVEDSLVAAVRAPRMPEAGPAASQLAAAQGNPAQPRLQESAAPGRGAASIVAQIAASLAPSAVAASGLTKNESAGSGVEQQSRAFPPAQERRKHAPRFEAETPSRSAAAVSRAPGQALLSLLPALAFRAVGTALLSKRALPETVDQPSAGANLLITSGGPGRAGTGSLSDVQGPSASPEPRVVRGGGLAIAGSLGVAIGVLDGLVERKVDAAIERRAAADKQTHDPESMLNRPRASDLFSEGAVRALMQKMRDLAQEERFRLGRLR